jgi:hypothetical protein
MTVGRRTAPLSLKLGTKTKEQDCDSRQTFLKVKRPRMESGERNDSVNPPMGCKDISVKRREEKKLETGRN